MSDDPILITIGGKRYWRDPIDGRTVPFVGGGSEDADPPAPPADPPAPPAPEATLTQSQVDAIVAREKAQARKAADKAAAEAIAAAKAEADKAAMGEADRARAEAAEITAQAQAVLADANAQRLAAKVERKLLAAGVPETALTRASRMVSLEADATDDDIVAEVEALRTEIPGLFTTPAPSNGEAPKPGAQPPAPAKPPTGGAPSGDPKEAAKALLRARGITPRSELNAA
jgi:hypothetical protein